ncbi:CBS domain-containing protein [Kitasatospora sp. NPDC001175]|uniref:CBS domain-containing protein n=1 Tax=Kitasatospora sp. NPDC001175 TaxID=3157103 RepID=UPI003D064B0B
MNHSILDGTSTVGFADPGHTRIPGRALVRTCMSRPAVAVTPDTDFATMVAAITASRRGVLPVVAPDGTVTGVVAASDLLAAYAEPNTAELLARDLMTAPAVTVAEDRTVAEAVATVHQRSIHHLPVVDGEDRLTGMVSPHDLLDALRRDDEQMRNEALTLALTPGTGVVPSSLHIRCERGRLTVAGRTRTRGDAAALCLQLARIEGIAGLTDRLRWDLDDIEGRAEA